MKLPHILGFYALIFALFISNVDAKSVILNEKIQSQERYTFFYDGYVSCDQSEMYAYKADKDYPQVNLKKGDIIKYMPVSTPNYSFVNNGKTLKISKNDKKDFEDVSYKAIVNNSCKELKVDIGLLKNTSRFFSVINLRSYDLDALGLSIQEFTELDYPKQSEKGIVKPFMKSRWKENKVKLSFEYKDSVLSDVLIIEDAEIVVNYE